MSSTNKHQMARNHINTTTQQYLDIAEIKEDTVVMRDGTMRAVLLVSSINFALKSEDEQNATIASYVGFLNSLDFPFQIVIQSRELDIEGYLDELRQKEKEQTNELLKIQTAEYIQYIQELVSMSSIMNKRFYAVIQFDPLSDKQKTFWARMAESFKPSTIIKMKEEKFKRRKAYLDTRVEQVIGGLGSVGLNSVQLDTQSLVELYYDSYNPRTSQQEKMTDYNKMRVEK